MGNPNAQNPPQKPQKPVQDPHEVGFLERRWRLLKTGLSGFGGYLLKPKTYLFAAGIAAAMLFIGGAWPLGATAAGLEAGAAAASLTAIAVKAVGFIAVGAVIHMGVDMVKEGKHCSDQTQACNGPNGHGAAQQEDYHPQNYGLGREDQVVPPLNTPTVNASEQQRF